MTARCDACGLAMREANGCAGVPYPHAHRFGEEPWFTSGELEPLDRCPDCTTTVGHDHHERCLAARCVLCADQARCCGHAIEAEA